MPTEIDNNAPQNIWKNQTTEAFKMSADQLRNKSQQRERKSRFEAGYSIITGFFVFIFFALAFLRTHGLAPRVGFGVLSLWGIYFAYRSRKRFGQGGPAPDAALNTTLRSYRSELEKRRDYSQNVWRRAGLPFVLLGSALVILPRLMQSIHSPKLIEPLLPLFALFVVWLVVFFFVRKRRRQQLQREIDELRSFESQSGA